MRTVSQINATAPVHCRHRASGREEEVAQGHQSTSFRVSASLTFDEHRGLSPQRNPEGPRQHNPEGLVMMGRAETRIRTSTFRVETNARPTFPLKHAGAMQPEEKVQFAGLFPLPFKLCSIWLARGTFERPLSSLRHSVPRILNRQPVLGPILAVQVQDGNVELVPLVQV
jgi:hypothetical protein